MSNCGGANVRPTPAPGMPPGPNDPRHPGQGGHGADGAGGGHHKPRHGQGGGHGKGGGKNDITDHNGNKPPTPKPGSGPAPAPTKPNDVGNGGGASSGGSNPGEKELVAEINRVRAQAGLPALAIKSNLSTAARQNDQANLAKGKALGGSADAMKKANGHHIPLSNNGARGEITAMNSAPSARALVQQWVESPGHAKIMFGREFTSVGGSMLGMFGTADFA
jgi:uncharacterized protein YkwD